MNRFPAPSVSGARLAMLCMALLAGCASTPQLPTLRAGESVAFVAAATQPSASEARVQNLDFGGNTTVGAGSGAAAGALYGLACGPFAVLCVPVGALAGAVVGSAGGAVVGLTAALPEEKSTRLRARLARALAAQEPMEALRNHLADRARSHWKVDGELPTSIVTLELKDLQLTSTRDERIGLVMHVLVSVKTAAAAEPRQKLYEYIGPISALAVWLDERSDLVDNLLNSASQQLAAQIVSELAGP